MADSVGEHTFVFQLTPLRAEPAEDAEQVSQALPGEPLAVEERRGGWMRVRTAYDYPGWLPAAALGGEPDPRWLAPSHVSPVEAARELLGAPYEWGGMTRRGIDCSGLVHMSYRATGRLVPRDADQQEAAGTPVERPEPGDLISYGDPVDHVAFWLGGGRILHATRRDGAAGVVEEPEPEELRARRRAAFRLPAPGVNHGSD
jgi:gamma-D-glutamyl-L-lysine dipeptidyl-peptidase